MSLPNKAKIALLAPFTIKGLDKALYEECKKIALDAEFFTAEYEKIYEEILSSQSDLKKFMPDISILLTDGESGDSRLPEREDIFIYDLKNLFFKYGKYNVVDDKLRYIGNIVVKPEYLPKLAHELMAYVKAKFSKNRKCIALDLDNTLWGGIVGEDGFEGIALDTKAPGNAYLEFQKSLLELNKRGIILAIASRNNYEDAIKVVREHPYMQLREDNFASIQIDWSDKVAQIKKIAEEVNIGLDSIVFFDDDALNRELVRQALPEVLVADMPKDPALYLRALKEINDFETLQSLRGIFTEEDLKRSEMYVAQRKANELKSQFSNMEDFLKSLEMKINIEKANDFTIPRIAQLTQKTNQFNLTTKRYAESDIRNFAKNQDFEVFSVDVKDKFGDHGIVGAFIAKNEGSKIVVDTFLLSCRVIGRNIENRMVEFIKEKAKERGASEIVGQYIPTPKNSICKDVYKNCGFGESENNLFKFEVA